MLAPRIRPLQLLTWAALTFMLFVVYRMPNYLPHPEDPNYRPRPPQQQRPPPPPAAPDAPIAETELNHGKMPANSTLGFGTIVVVSNDESTRRHGLIQAANVTELEIVIPSQPRWNNDVIQDFKLSPDSKMADGSIMAWLGHHNALQWFLNSGHETALIVEDDIDWDIHLRSLQIPLAADATRSLLNSKVGALANKENFWGHPAAWDLLYLGHCGDYFNPIPDGIGPGHQVPSNLTSIPHKIFSDPSLPSFPNLHPFTSALMTALAIPEHHRAVHRSKFPLCTFAYAVNKKTAQRLLDQLAPAKEAQAADPQHRVRAYDVAILNACRNGYNAETNKDDPNGLKCYSVNPELFHHVAGDSTIAAVEKARGHNVGIPPVDAAGAAQAAQRKETSNINCGFVGEHFSFNDGDKDRLLYLQQTVGQRGICLKPGRH